MRRQPIAVIVAVIAACAVVAGCGGGDDESSAGTLSTSSTKAGFVKQAEAVCKATIAEVKVKGRPLFKKIGQTPRAILAEEIIDDLIAPAFEKQIRELRALEPPLSERKEVEKILGAIEKMLAKITKNPAAQSVYPYTEAEELAAKYGLPSCGHP